MPDAMRAGKRGDPIGCIEILRGANLLDDLQLPSHAHDLNALGYCLDLSFQPPGIAIVDHLQPQVLCRCRC